MTDINADDEINSNNHRDDNIIVVIDGVVQERKPRRKPKNPLRWKPDGTHNTQTLDPQYHRQYY